MKIADVVELIKNSNGKIISLEFKKRTPPHDLRQMVCRTGVKKHLKGGEKAYSDKDKDLISVFDMKEQGYRSIPIEGILRIKQDGDWVEVTHDA